MPPNSSPQFAFPLDSEMWRINHQRCGLLFGPAAAILQIAHPRIARGVADHSNFETDSIGRLRRTLGSTNRIAFGTVQEAESTRERMRQVHRGVQGRVSADMPGPPRYSALEPDLLLWVLATLIEAALQGYELVFGRLPLARKEPFYREMRQFGAFFELPVEFGPPDYPAFQRYYRDMLEGDVLGSHPLCAKLAQCIVKPADSRGARLVGAAVRFLPLETLPPPLRERLGLKSTLISRTTMAAVRRLLPALFPILPPVLRLGPEARERLRREASQEAEQRKIEQSGQVGDQPSP